VGNNTIIFPLALRNNNNNKWRSLGIVDGASLPFLSFD